MSLFISLSSLTTWLHLFFLVVLCSSLPSVCIQPIPPAALAGYNNLEVAEYLLEHGADVNAQDKGGLIPLHNAASYGVRHTDTISAPQAAERYKMVVKQVCFHLERRCSNLLRWDSKRLIIKQRINYESQPLSQICWLLRQKSTNLQLCFTLASCHFLIYFTLVSTKLLKESWNTCLNENLMSCVSRKTNTDVYTF